MKRLKKKKKCRRAGNQNALLKIHTSKMLFDTCKKFVQKCQKIILHFLRLEGTLVGIAVVIAFYLPSRLRQKTTKGPFGL